ncbi:hypothetical protein [Caulobacter hibisci]|uniref:Uncharacterized protein n=1 Tax=Caulobacter hibisci TaxID=2035993 RepID=A0ABS0T2Z9_9CAUL|nr:hypothetical protein [Caulobacter hibisci]MBI1685861.1 hypothetical protein [Caulobacter hibisci]
MEPSNGPKPPKRKRIKVLGLVTAVIAIVAVAMFIGVNAHYAALTH